MSATPNASRVPPDAAIIATAVVDRSGSRAILVESLDEMLSVVQFAARRLSFSVREVPEARASSRIDVFLDDLIEANLGELLTSFNLAIPQSVSTERKLVDVALAAIASELSRSQLGGGASLKEVRRGVEWLRELSSQPAGSDEEALHYIKAKLYWGWRYDQTEMGLSWFDAMVLGVRFGTMDRVSLRAEGKHLKRKRLPNGNVLYAPMPKLMDEFPSLPSPNNRAAPAAASKHPPTRKAAARVFQTAFDSYEFRRQVGEGESGWVYEVGDSRGNRAAIKVLKPKVATTERRNRFKNEIWFASRNQHPNIVTVLDHGVTTIDSHTTPFFVMPYYDESLRDLIKVGIAKDQVLHLFDQVLSGVQAAHQRKVYHRDLKPENILYSGTEGRLAVADFGIAHFEEEELYTLVETGQADRLANFQYAAPEQRTRGSRVDHRADIFALGLILNELFTGQVPQAAGITTIGAVAPPYGYLDELVEKMRQQDPDRRPQTIAELKAELAARRRLTAS